MKKRSGFTLIELLVVIAIISVLTILTVSQFQTAKKKASDVARKGDLNAMSKALQLYFTDYNQFPAENNGLIVVNGSARPWGGTFDDTSVSPPYVYMKVLPKENVYPAANPYCYKVDASAKKYALFAKLENTADSQCSGNYSCNGKSGYCYAVMSPNTSLDANGNLQ